MILPKKGRRNKIYFLPSATGFKAPKFIYAKQENMYFLRCASRNTVSRLATNALRIIKFLELYYNGYYV